MTPDPLGARLRALFITELEEQVRALDPELLALEREPRNPERLSSVFRILHTLKGAAHAAAVPEVENVCHALEALLGHARESQIVLGETEFSLLLAAADALGDAARRLREGSDLEDSPLAALQSVRFESSRTTISGGPRPSTRRAQPDPSEQATSTDTRPAEPPPGAQAPTPPADHSTDQVRVAAGKLDALVASSGQLLVGAGRLGTTQAEAESLCEIANHLRVRWRNAAHRLRLQNRRSSVGESVLAELAEIERDLQHLVDDCRRVAAAGARESRALSNLVAEVGARVQELHLRPLSEACVALPRTVRDLATASGKEVRLEIAGAEVEADRAVIGALQDVLLHLVRNAVDHGIETPADRERVGKPRAGTVTVAASLERQRLRLTVADDGKGLDLAAVRARLAQRGLQVPEEDSALVEAIFQPGVSTLDEPTKVSGRGVGLDAVRTRMERMGGSVEVGWTPGGGTAFTLECPPSIATMRAVLVAVGAQTLAIPSSRVERLLRVRPTDIRRAEGHEVILTGGSPVPIVSLARLLGPPLQDPPESEHLAVVCLAMAERRIALAVDRLLTEEEIVVRPVERLARPPAYLGGAALLRSGSVAPVLNAGALIAAGLEGLGGGLRNAGIATPQAIRRRILVVDDSLTTRTLEQSILEAEGYEVLTAIDGEVGWRLLQEKPVDLVVSDVDMPRMSGFDLCKAIRASRHLSDLPIILVTAQEAPKQRERGLEVGADAYLPKSSFDQQNLLDTIQQLLG